MDNYSSIINKDFVEGFTSKVFTDGWDHTVVAVDNSIAYRFSKNKRYEQKLYIEKEFIDKFVLKTSLQIPKMSIHEREGIIYATYPFIHGESFSYPLANSLQREDANKIAHDLGLFLQQLHTFPIEIAAKLGIEIFDIESFWEKKYQQSKKMFKDLFTIAQNKWLSDTYRIFLDSISVDNIHLSVNHSDLKPPHIIIDSNRLKGIIDFSEVVIGDPAYDFQYLGRYGQKFLSNVLKNYREVDKYFLARQKFYEKLSYLEDLEGVMLAHNDNKINQSLDQINQVANL